MTGFEQRISGVGGDRITKEPQPLPWRNFINLNLQMVALTWNVPTRIYKRILLILLSCMSETFDRHGCFSGWLIRD